MSKRYLVLGDIHGRTIWKDIIEKENPDKIIFLGDYVSTHEDISSKQQIDNLENILAYKENNLDNVILLRGNHCVQHLGYYWAECSGLDKEVFNYMSKEGFEKRFLSLTQWIYVDKELRTIFSHAGISARWLQDVEKYIVRTRGAQYDDGNQEVLLELINTIEPNEIFGFTPDSPFDYYGNSATQPLTWIRPLALCRCNISGWDQIVGHTPVKNITNIKKAAKNKQNIWLCDALDKGQYMIIDNNIYEPKSLNL